MPEKRILYVADKWWFGEKNNGLSEWESNLLTSLEGTKLAKTDVFHFDEYYRINKKKGDPALFEKIELFKPHLIATVIYREPGTATNVPELQTFEKIKNELNIPIVAIWGDIEASAQAKISISLIPFVSLHVATASEASVRRINRPDKYLYMWVPKDPVIFNDPKKTRDIDIGYFGSPKKERIRKVQHLKEHGIVVTTGGGERQEHLTAKDYADRYQRSKITLSFSREAYSHVINARPFEAMACGSMILEQENFETPKLFVPFVDYVPYTTNKDLAKKIKYYLTHDKERQIIAENGKRKVLERYSAFQFWDTVIKRALGDDRGNFPEISLKNSDLSLLPRRRACVLHFLNALCSNNFGFKVYILAVNRTNWKFLRYLFFKTLRGMAGRLKRQ